MSEERISKLRAIQVVLSSVPMSKHCASELTYALYGCHKNDELIGVLDAQVNAALRVCLDDLEVRPEWGKKIVIMRMQQAKDRIRKMVEGRE